MTFFQFLSGLSYVSKLQSTPYAPHFQFGSPEKLVWRRLSNFSFDMTFFQFLSGLSYVSKLQSTPYAPHFQFGSPEKLVWRRLSNFSLDMTFSSSYPECQHYLFFKQRLTRRTSNSVVLKNSSGVAIRIFLLT